MTRSSSNLRNWALTYFSMLTSLTHSLTLTNSNGLTHPSFKVEVYTISVLLPNLTIQIFMEALSSVPSEYDISHIVPMLEEHTFSIPTLPKKSTTTSSFHYKRRSLNQLKLVPLLKIYMATPLVKFVPNSPN